MNLRYVLETQDSVADAGAFLTGTGAGTDPYQYAAGHLLVFADPIEARVFEYDPAPHRGMRNWESTMKTGIDWVTHDYTIGAVNSFVLDGIDSFDNHTGNNVLRWNTMRTQLQSKLDDTATPGTVTVPEVKEVITYHVGSKPGADKNDLYRGHIQQTIIYQPATPNSAEVHFHPLCVQSPGSYKDDDGTFFTVITADF